MSRVVYNGFEPWIKDLKLYTLPIDLTYNYK